MDGALTISHDKASDTLYLDRVQPYAEQESDDIGNSVITRFNPDTDEIETLEIMFFSTRVSNGQALQIPLSANFCLPEHSSPVDSSHGLPPSERWREDWSWR